MKSVVLDDNVERRDIEGRVDVTGDGLSTQSMSWRSYLWDTADKSSEVCRHDVL